MEHTENNQVEAEVTEQAEERLEVEVPTEIRAGRSSDCSGKCYYQA